MNIPLSKSSASLSVASVVPDDIASLEKFLDAGPFDYVDVAIQEAHAQALRKWPLLAEIAAWRNAGERGSE
ncbi:hypothetical protein H0A66_16250 [Alcaligenaceae bacterium]|nr:hypothetical protein [Alcaligenaceae bacterium]